VQFAVEHHPWLTQKFKRETTPFIKQTARADRHNADTSFRADTRTAAYSTDVFYDWKTTRTETRVVDIRASWRRPGVKCEKNV